MNMRFGKTEMIVNKNGFGALPIQRVSMAEAEYILQKAYDNGINFYDTAHYYTDSQEKLGRALHNVRHNIFLASKTMAPTPEEFNRQLDNALKMLQTDYLDLYQFHNPPACRLPDDGTGLYEAMMAAVKAGKVRHVGITSHLFGVAETAIESGLFETLQFPFSYLASDRDLEIVEKCRKADMGFLGMKAMSGGLIKNSKAAYAYMAQPQFDHVLPIWGIQRESELEEFLSYDAAPPVLDEELMAAIEKDRKELAGDFCRGCGYCQPCPQGIEIYNAARMSLLLRRSPTELQLTPEVQAKMKLIEKCTECGTCKSRCPYGLDTPALLKKNYEDYKEVLAGKPL